MIDTSRLGQLDGVLQHLAASAAKPMGDLRKSLRKEGFTDPESFELAAIALEAALAIPSPSEQAAKAAGTP